MSPEHDPEWRERVDSVVLYDKLEDLTARIKDLEILLKGKGGLLSEYDRHDDKLTRLYAVIFQDPTGQKGLLHDVDVIMGRRRDKDENRALKWQFWGAIFVAIITTMGLLLTNFKAIREAFLRTDPLEQTIEKAKHPKSKRKVVVYRHVPSDDTTESLPNHAD